MSVVWIMVSNVPVPASWMEAGPYFVFISSLLWAVVHLWRAKRSDDKAREERDAAMIEKQRETNDRLAGALEKLTKTKHDE